MFETTVRFASPASQCKVIAGNGSFGSMAGLVNSLECSSTFIVSDENVLNHHGDNLRMVSGAISARSSVLILPAGERTKSSACQISIHKWLLENGADRGSMLIGIGGGVICDIVGFAAATFMRGIDHMFVPTTLVAQVDAAIGGKNGINLPEAKNMIGTIKQPMAIIADPVFLKTLRQDHFSEGMAELLKMSLIRSRKLGNLIEDLLSDSKNGGQQLASIIQEGIRLKLDVVKKDQFEGGLRRILNFGHTTAHALESLSGYRRRMPHGKAVAFGMVVALDLSRALCSLTDETVRWGVDQIRRLYRSFPVADINPGQVWDVIVRDKKRMGSEVQFVLLESFAQPVVKSVAQREFSMAFRKIAKSWSR